MLKKFRDNNIDSVYYEDLDNYDNDDDYADYDDDKYRKIVTVRRLLKGFDRDYYKPITADRGRFWWKRKNYIKYRSKGDRYKSLSLKKYLNLIGPYWRDFINEHKPIAELNNNQNQNLNTTTTTTTNNNNNNVAEWKI